MRNSKMAKVRGTAVKSQDKTNKSGSKKLSPIKTKKDFGTKSSDKVSSTSKISKTSKTAISKTNKTAVTKVIKKKVKEVSWLKKFLEDSKGTKNKKRDKGLTIISGIMSFTPSSLTLRIENGVDYALFPWHHNRVCGFAKMGPRSFKQKSRSTSTVHLTVLIGKVQLLADKCTKDFECGAMITIPKGIHYGLKNPTSRETFLRIQSICE